MKKQVKQEQSNITLADVGKTLYTTNGQDIWLLDSFKPEPQVKMFRLNIVTGDSPNVVKEGGLSGFVKFIRLLPEKEPKKPRKTRSDAGTHRSITTDDIIQVIAQESSDAPAPAPETLRMALVIDMASPDNPYNTVTIGNSHAKSKDLKKAVINALVHYDGKIPDGLSGEDKKQLESILKAP